MMIKPTLVVFTGSGVSAESGLATFRDEDGTWDNYDVNEVCSVEALKNTPEKVYSFFNVARKACSKVQPNAAHIGLAALEEHFQVVIITQNVDDLHERAGSTKVFHLHGEINKMRDVRTDEIVPNDVGDLVVSGNYRPHVVMFGEMPYNYDVAEAWCEAADYGMIIGTSLEVYPAAGLVYSFGITTPVILIDPNPPVDEKTYPNIVVIREEATTGLGKAAALLHKDVSGTSRIGFNEIQAL